MSRKQKLITASNFKSLDTLLFGLGCHESTSKRQKATGVIQHGGGHDISLMSLPPIPDSPANGRGGESYNWYDDPTAARSSSVLCVSFFNEFVNVPLIVQDQGNTDLADEGEVDICKSRMAEILEKKRRELDLHNLKPENE